MIGTVLALIAIWVALDVAVLVAISRYRDSLEGSDRGDEELTAALVSDLRTARTPEVCVGWIDKRGRFVRMRRRAP